MDALYLLQSAQQAGLELSEPVSKWGGTLSTGALVFFQTAENSSVTTSVTDASGYFSEALRLQDPANLKCALSSMLSICRGNMYLYAALATSEALQFLSDLLRFPDTLLIDKAAGLLSGAMCRFPGKFSKEEVFRCADYGGGSEAGKMQVLANLLKNDAWRLELFEQHGMRILSGCGSGSVPTTYKALMCLWLASFSKEVVIPQTVIGSINEVFKTTRAEKAVRIALMALENMLKFKVIWNI